MTDQPDQPRFRLGVPAGGHVSGVFWGDGPPELVFLHDAGESARAWDTVALAAGRASVAIDLPGHGRSDSRRDGRYEPGELAPAVAEAIRSFAPRADRGGRRPGRPHRGRAAPAPPAAPRAARPGHRAHRRSSWRAWASR